MTSHSKTKPERANRHGQQQRGVTSLEYALMASLIAIAVVVSVAAVGGASSLSWSTTADRILAAILAALGL